MINTNSLKFINFVEVLKNPTNIVPSLSDNEVYTIIVDSIRAYVDHEINLETLVDIVRKLKLFSGINKNKNEDISEALIKLSDLANFVKKEEDNSDKVRNILIDALDKLSYK